MLPNTTQAFFSRIMHARALHFDCTPTDLTIFYFILILLIYTQSQAHKRAFTSTLLFPIFATSIKQTAT